MKRSISKRAVLAAALAATITLGLSSFAAAQYDDDDRYYQGGSGEQARQYGYQSGYRDGYWKGQHEGRENDPGDINVRDLREATHGYQPWMGPVWYFRDGYRNGYRNGFRAGYQAGNSGWSRDDDARYYPNSGYGQQYGASAYQIGYQDGASVAREDAAYGKPYNPRPRGRYDDMDHGYRREYGNKGAYKAQYANGYREGYQSAIGRQ